MDEDALREAARRRRSWKVLCLPLATKVDLFIKRDGLFDESELNRRRFVSLGPEGTGLFVASPEDVVLRKLTWYRAGGEVSDSQWRDVRGVLAVSQAGLDWRYLEQWAERLGVADLLQRLAPGAHSP